MSIDDISQGKGYDLRDHVLACFGGAGGQHACAVSFYPLFLKSPSPSDRSPVLWE